MRGAGAAGLAYAPMRRRRRLLPVQAQRQELQELLAYAEREMRKEVGKGPALLSTTAPQPHALAICGPAGCPAPYHGLQLGRAAVASHAICTPHAHRVTLRPHLLTRPPPASPGRRLPRLRLPQELPALRLAFRHLLLMIQAKLELGKPAGVEVAELRQLRRILEQRRGGGGGPQQASSASGMS